MSHHLIDRRRVLALVCAAGVTVGSFARATDRNATRCVSTFADGIDASAIRELGAQYRARYPNGGESKSVLLLLQDQARAPASIVAKLRSMVGADYNHDRTVELFGWHVSRTEAQLFAAPNECLD